MRGLLSQPFLGVEGEKERERQQESPFGRNHEKPFLVSPVVGVEETKNLQPHYLLEKLVYKNCRLETTEMLQIEESANGQLKTRCATAHLTHLAMFLIVGGCPRVLQNFRTRLGADSHSSILTKLIVAPPTRGRSRGNPTASSS